MTAYRSVVQRPSSVRQVSSTSVSPAAASTTPRLTESPGSTELAVFSADPEEFDAFAVTERALSRPVFSTRMTPSSAQTTRHATNDFSVPSSRPRAASSIACPMRIPS